MTDHADAWLGVRAAWDRQAHDRLPLAEWVGRYRVVIGGPWPGRWQHTNAPMSMEPMAAVSDPRVNRVSVWAPAQLMKSELAINVALWTAAQARDVLFYEPDLNLLKRFIGDRIRPAIHALGEDSFLETPSAGKLKKLDSTMALRLSGGGTILGLTPDMKTGKSSYTAPVIVIDELDKMQDPSMITAAESRMAMYGADGCVLAVSTPTLDVAGSICRLWHEGSRGTWHGLCRHCTELVSVAWGRVVFDKDDDTNWLADTARMVCSACGTNWSEGDRQWAVRRGQYIHEDPDSPHRSFRIPGSAHLVKTVQDIAREGATKFRTAREEGTWVDYQLFVNERLGEVWTDEDRGLSARQLERSTYALGARGADDLGEVDRRIVLITSGSDTGDHAIWSEVVAWGIDPRSGRVLCHGLLYRQHGGQPDDYIEDAELWRAYEKTMDGSRWRHAGYPGVHFGVQRAIIDAGHRPEVVSEWCAEKYRQQARNEGLGFLQPYGARILPSKGKWTSHGPHPVDLAAGMRRRQRGQRRSMPEVVDIEVGQVKEMLHAAGLRDQQLPDGIERAIVWPDAKAACGYTPSWFKEFANEYRTLKRNLRKGTVEVQWTVKHEIERKNEALDCRVYAAAAALVHVYPHSLQVGLLRLAAVDAASERSPWTAEEADQIRGHLKVAEAGGAEYASATNVEPIHGT